MRHAIIAALPALALLGGCGSSGSSSGDDPNLPSGLPAGTPDDGDVPTLQPVSAAIPEAQRLSVGGFDSTSAEWDSLRRSSLFNTVTVCGDLMSAMIASRGAPEESSEDSVSPQTWWYWTQGYTVTFDWSGDACEAEDFRFVPQL